jgi:phosphogluconate dehydratase
MSLHPLINSVTEEICQRSQSLRKKYLDGVSQAISQKPQRFQRGCANQAHALAGCNHHDKGQLKNQPIPSIGIVTAYNDMLSAHQPYELYPEMIRKIARDNGAVAQVAGGVPAMCDGITQGETGMELSLFSRDVIALATSVALSHQTFDSSIYLGICDKIVPGLVMGALTFGHLPAVFIPSGPMRSGLSNSDKAKIRQLYAEGKVGKEDLLDAEIEAYHSPGTCTFYGTANTNQIMLEVMGLQLPGSSFVNPDTRLRHALTKEAVLHSISISSLGKNFIPIADILDEKAFVNAIVALLASGGSTNHSLHLLAMARRAGIILTWDDISAIAKAVPLLARIYPNGKADVNQFHDTGGTVFLIQQLLEGHLLHGDCQTITGQSLAESFSKEKLDKSVHHPDIIRTITEPFRNDGGLMLLQGNLGRAIIKTSAVDTKYLKVEAPARIFHSQTDFQEAFKKGELNRDVIVVLRFQGPKANGMPELHKLIPVLGILQDRGYKVGLLTDGRLSGASGKVPAAIHLTPEAEDNGPLALIEDNDIINLNALEGHINVMISPETLKNRKAVKLDLSINHHGCGRELFGIFRQHVGRADDGASIFDNPYSS